jgi:hypothetical protein
LVQGIDVTNWIDTYNLLYKDKLSLKINGKKRGLKIDPYDRSVGFSIIFEELFKIKKKGFQIIETGTVRDPRNWRDGNSGFLFSELVKQHGGFVRSVDIAQEAVDTANQFIDNQYYKSFCSDSVSWLKSLTDLESVDFFYLDSYDVNWRNDEPSANHHLQEFLAIEPYLKNCIVAIDDNSFLLNGTRTGKGRAIYQYLHDKKIYPIFDEYQIIYIFKD